MLAENLNLDNPRVAKPEDRPYAQCHKYNLLCYGNTQAHAENLLAVCIQNRIRLGELKPIESDKSD